MDILDWTLAAAVSFSLVGGFSYLLFFSKAQELSDFSEGNTFEIDSLNRFQGPIVEVNKDSRASDYESWKNSAFPRQTIRSCGRL